MLLHSAVLTPAIVVRMLLAFKILRVDAQNLHFISAEFAKVSHTLEHTPRNGNICGKQLGDYSSI